jgi:hypothetical protein
LFYSEIRKPLEYPDQAIYTPGVAIFVLMEFEAEIPYADGKAMFRITRENPGIYSASLLYFGGEQRQSPPAEITLIRGVRGWTGSEPDEILINVLGNLIEAHLIKPYKKQPSK